MFWRVYEPGFMDFLMYGFHFRRQLQAGCHYQNHRKKATDMDTAVIITVLICATLVILSAMAHIGKGRK